MHQEEPSADSESAGAFYVSLQTCEKQVAVVHAPQAVVFCAVNSSLGGEGCVEEATEMGRYAHASCGFMGWSVV